MSAEFLHGPVVVAGRGAHEVDTERCCFGPCVAARHDPGAFQAGLQDLAGPAAPGMARCVEVIAMDGFSGFKSAATKEMPQARAVLDPFHVVRLAGQGLEQFRRRVQQELHG